MTKVAGLLCILAIVVPAASAKRSLQQNLAPAASTGVTDIDILNYALNLEYLEAEFYSCASSGKPLPDDLRGGGPASTGCQKAQLTPTGQAYANEIAQDELDHVKFLKEALGANAIAIPQIDIGTSFSSILNTAVGQTLSPPFSPYLNDLFFFHGAFLFEDVGVTAYLGGAPFISNPAYLSDAARIMAIEGYHAGVIRTLLYQQRDTVTPYSLTVSQIIDDVSNLRGSVGGGGDQGIIVAGANGEQANIVPCNTTTCLAFTRTPFEVIDIVTAGAGPQGGGFFPKGLNGVSALTANAA